MKHHLYFQDEKSNKFWSIELIGKGYKTSHGRVGSTPRETHKEFASIEVAKKKIASLVKSKLRKGYKEGDIPPYKAIEWDKLPMDNTTFWKIIALLDWKKTGDDDAVIRPSVHALQQMPVDNIKAFADILSRKLYDLDALKYAVELGEYKYKKDKYFSVDNFLYERCVIVANGKSYYDKVLNNPKKFQKESLEFEALLAISGSAFEQKTGKVWNYYCEECSYETYSNKEGWK